MKLTKKLAVALHRRLWSWVADETERQQRIVRKSEYPLFKHLEVESNCWCCEYADSECISHCSNFCPIKWSNGSCDGEYRKWGRAKTWQEAAHWARVIAELPERENVE